MVHSSSVKFVTRTPRRQWIKRETHRERKIRELVAKNAVARLKRVLAFEMPTRVAITTRYQKGPRRDENVFGLGRGLSVSLSLSLSLRAL